MFGLATTLIFLIALLAITCQAMKAARATTITALHQQFSWLGVLERFALPTGEQSKDEMLSEIIKALYGGAFCLSL